MSNVLNRINKKFLQSVNTPEYSGVDWIINPDLSGVEGFDSKYWVITGDVITLMEKSARDSIDVQITSNQRDYIASRLDAIQDADVEFYKLLIVELNRKSDKINDILSAAENSTDLSSFKIAMNAINDEPLREMSQLKVAVRTALDN